MHSDRYARVHCRGTLSSVLAHSAASQNMMVIGPFILLSGARASRNIWRQAGWAGTICAERDHRRVWAAIYAGVDARELLIHHAHELRVARRLGAVWCRGNDASTHVIGVAGVLAICDRRGNERVLVRDTRGLGEVDHLVGNVLLVADAARGKKRVDAG